MSILNYKCKSCGADLFFSPEKQKWVCNYCHKEHTLKEMKENYENENLNKSNEYNTEYVCYTCKNCGAEIITNQNTSATFCIYCNSPSIIKDRLRGEFKPDKIIPFKVSKDDVIESYKKYKKSFVLAPKDYYTESILKKIKPIYVPSYLFSLNVNAEVEYIEPKSDYKESREFEKMRKKVKAKFKDIPIDASLGFPNEFMNSIEPFNYKEMVDFSPEYLSGFYADKYDIVNSAVKNEVEGRVNNTVKQYMKKQFHNSPYYISSQIQENTKIEINNIESRYVLLPVWLLNTSYQNNIQYFIVNGQTGKVAGNIPINKLKYIIACIITFLLLTIPELVLGDIEEHILFLILSIVINAIISTLIIKYMFKFKHKGINKRKTAAEYADNSSIEIIDIKDEDTKK